MKVIATTLSLLLPVLYWLRNGSLSKMSGAISGKYGVIDGRQPVVNSSSGGGSNKLKTAQSLVDTTVTVPTTDTVQPMTIDPVVPPA